VHSEEELTGIFMIMTSEVNNEWMELYFHTSFVFLCIPIL